jgi:hypothetical protein
MSKQYLKKLKEIGKKTFSKKCEELYSEIFRIGAMIAEDLIRLERKKYNPREFKNDSYVYMERVESLSRSLDSHSIYCSAKTLLGNEPLAIEDSSKLFSFTEKGGYQYRDCKMRILVEGSCKGSYWDPGIHDSLLSLIGSKLTEEMRHFLDLVKFKGELELKIERYKKIEKYFLEVGIEKNLSVF